MPKARQFRQYDVYLGSLDPARGSEMKKTRPCVIVSPDSMNDNLRTVIAAPLTSSQKNYPSRVPSSFQGQNGEIALDQIRAMDKTRLVKKIGRLDDKTARAVAGRLVEIFS